MPSHPKNVTVSSVATLVLTQLCDEEPESESSAPAFARKAVQPSSKVHDSLKLLFLGYGCVQSPATFPWAALESPNPPAAAWFIYINRHYRKQGESPQVSRGELSVRGSNECCTKSLP